LCTRGETGIGFGVETGGGVHVEPGFDVELEGDLVL
jgi:hypothetical protein